MTFCYLSDTTGLSGADCVTINGSLYCLPGTATVPGSQLLNNSAAILNYYNTLSGSATPFLYFLVALYTDCLDDYSLHCLQEILSRFNGNLSANTNPRVLEAGNSWQDITPFYFVGSYSFFWESSIEQSYCLSSPAASASCTECSSGCAYSNLGNSGCIAACNTTACCYDNLDCLGASGVTNLCWATEIAMLGARETLTAVQVVQAFVLRGACMRTWRQDCVQRPVLDSAFPFAALITAVLAAPIQE